MADSPSHEWEGSDPRILAGRAKDTRKAGPPHSDDDTTTTGWDRYRTPDPVGHRLTNDPDDEKAMSSKSAENKSVKKAAKK